LSFELIISTVVPVIATEIIRNGVIVIVYYYISSYTSSNIYLLVMKIIGDKMMHNGSDFVYLQEQKYVEHDLRKAKLIGNLLIVFKSYVFIQFIPSFIHSFFICHRYLFSRVMLDIM